MSGIPTSCKWKLDFKSDDANKPRLIYEWFFPDDFLPITTPSCHLEIAGYRYDVRYSGKSGVGGGVGYMFIFNNYPVVAGRNNIDGVYLFCDGQEYSMGGHTTPANETNYVHKAVICTTPEVPIEPLPPAPVVPVVPVVPPTTTQDFVIKLKVVPVFGTVTMNLSWLLQQFNNVLLEKITGWEIYDLKMVGDELQIYTRKNGSITLAALLLVLLPVIKIALITLGVVVTAWVIENILTGQQEVKQAQTQADIIKDIMESELSEQEKINLVNEIIGAGIGTVTPGSPGENGFGFDDLMKYAPMLILLMIATSFKK